MNFEQLEANHLLGDNTQHYQDNDLRGSKQEQNMERLSILIDKRHLDLDLYYSTEKIPEYLCEIVA